jgi:hypothetical protein
MEIDITDFFKSADPSRFSASIAETGYSDIGKRTWAESLAHAPPMLITRAQLAALRSYARDFGAWPVREISAWPSRECNALFVQLVSADMREGGLDLDPSDAGWAKYEAYAASGRIQGAIYRSGDRVYYSLSS